MSGREYSEVHWDAPLLEELLASTEVVVDESEGGKSIGIDPVGLPARFRANVRDRLGEHFDVRVSDDAIRDASFIAAWLAKVLGLGFGADPALLREVARKLRAGPGLVQRRAEVVRLIELLLAHPDRAYAIERLCGRRPSEDSPGRMSVLYALDNRFGLHDQFGQLDPTKAAAILRKASVSGGKGGAGNVGAALVAARLSVMVGAFGDRDEEKSKRAFLAAASAARRQNSPKRRKGSAAK